MRNQKHIIKDRNTAGSRPSPLPVLQPNWWERRREQHKKGQRNFVFFSVSMPILLSLSLSVLLVSLHCPFHWTLLSLIFLVNVLVLLCFQWGYTGFHWLFELQIWHFYFTICLACFASQFINCSFTHSLFILSASPQSVNDCLLSRNQFF